MTPQEEANRLMDNGGFTHYDRWCALVWAAKMEECPSCGVGPGQQCTHLGSKYKGQGRKIKWPHPDRVNYKKLIKELRRRGYRVEV
jgi:hypothetical protein